MALSARSLRCPVIVSAMAVQRLDDRRHLHGQRQERDRQEPLEANGQPGEHGSVSYCWNSGVMSLQGCF